MPVSIDVNGLDALQARVKAWPERIDAELAKQVEAEVRPMVSHMSGKASAIGGAAMVAARSLGISATANGMTVSAGDSGLSGLLLHGGEFGGRKRPKVSYATRSRSGTAYFVFRRTTQQFKPHLGNRGYWFWPTVRADLKGVNGRVGALLTKVVRS